ncbi:MAG: hypothetical protein R3327_00015 [Nitrosopumilaceae archaeon]|nr:hypothetical protein [Nitrosopumilaceae archaeon]
MAERITVMLDEEIVKKIRNRQAKKIKETASSVSFSSILNEVLQECNKL